VSKKKIKNSARDAKKASAQRYMMSILKLWRVRRGSQCPRLIAALSATRISVQARKVGDNT
jgi:hypothetical protein